MVTEADRLHPCALKMLSWRTLCRWIYKKYLVNGNLKVLRRKGQGHGSKACFAALEERKTRFYIAVKMPDRRAATMENAIVSALSAIPPQLVKSITCDRGTEFANRRRIEERLHCDVYFADPHCAWQKGANEDLNGLLREF